MELIQKVKKGGVRVLPHKNQKAYMTQVKYKGHSFKFFRDRGLILSKNIRKDYTQKNGETFVVQDFDFEELIAHFKKLGHTIIDLDKKTENKKIVVEAAKKLNKEAQHDLNKNKRIKT